MHAALETHRSSRRKIWSLSPGRTRLRGSDASGRLVLLSAITASLDRHFLAPPLDRPSGPLAINAHDFTIGSRHWPFVRTERLITSLDPQNRVRLSFEGNVFTLGMVSKTWAEPGEPQREFSPEAGDVVSFTRSPSRLAWPTPPLRRSILGAKLPRWRRHVYDRLRWTKNSGACLEIIWRDEQAYYAGTGWTDANSNQLVTVRVQRSPYEDAVMNYLISKKGWSGRDCRLEWSASDADVLLVTVFASTDASVPHPGAGKSVVLQVDSASGHVVKELSFQ